MPDLEATVRGSLELHSDLARDSIVQAVAQRLGHADPLATFERTGYFNHSYLPDLIATWSSGDGRRARPYYLRLDLTQSQVQDDVERLGRDAPAFIGLLPTEGPSEPDSHLENLGSTMVAEGSALDELASVPADDAFAARVPPAVVRAGRGHLEDNGVTELAVAASSGFLAASEGNVDTTRTVLRALQRHISTSEAVDLERMLGVVWLGSGASPTDFPAQMDFDSAPRAGTLRSTLAMLFAQPAIEQEGFWERVSEWVGVQDLLGMVEVLPNPNLDLLMSFLSTRLKFVSVAAGSPTARQVGYYWSVVENGLQLSSPWASLNFVTDGRATVTGVRRLSQETGTA